jgi:hypothetical protein
MAAPELCCHWPEQIECLILARVCDIQPAAAAWRMGTAPDLLRSDRETDAVVEIIESLMGTDSAKQIRLCNDV